MRKPTKPPPPPPPPQLGAPQLPPRTPPPPLPPRSHLSYSLSRQSCYGIPASCGGAVSCGGGSEYAESVCSMPTRLLHQPVHHVLSPASCHSCKSESAYGIEPVPRICHCCRSPLYASPSCESSSAYLSPVSSMQCISQICMPRFGTHSPCHRLSHGCRCYVPSCRTVSHCRTCTPSSTADLNKPLPPTPRQRVARPVLSISPKPELRRNESNGVPNQHNRSHDKCKPAHYRRHIEQHVVKIFNYLKCRDERRRLCEKEIYDRQLAHSENASTIMRMYAAKESRHLRSLRAPISKGDFDVIKKLGAGNFGNVLLVRKKESLKDALGPEQYAMKRLKKSQVFQQNHLAHVTAERDILAEADSEWIVKLYSSFQDDNYLYFILEYVPGGDMMSLLEYKNVFPEDWASFYIAEISLALQFVHNKGFVHRDIKPDNILIDARGHIKLTDFGLCTGFRWTHDSKYYADDTFNPAHQNENIPLLGNGNGNSNGNGDHIEDHPTITKALTKREIEHSSRKRALSLVGSPNYIAPEVLQSAFTPQENANEKLCDWWSVGVILYEMVIGYCPFIDVRRLRDSNYDPRLDTPYQTQMRIIQWRDHLRFPSPNDPNGPPLIAAPIREHTEQLIRGLLCDPHERLCRNGIGDIQNHPFFENIDWENIRSTDACHIPERTDKFDTRNPPPESHPSVPDNMFDYPNGTKMPLPDFTFRCFWQK